MITELTKLLTAYYDWCVKDQKRRAKELKNPIAPFEFSFEGFYQWLQDETTKK